MRLRVIRIVTLDGIEFAFEFLVSGDALPEGVELVMAGESFDYTSEPEGLPV
jgi:hypothetical protein